METALERARRAGKVDPGLIPVYRAMRSADKIAASFRFSELIQGRVETHLRALRPEWSETEIRAEVAKRCTRDAG